MAGLVEAKSLLPLPLSLLLFLSSLLPLSFTCKVRTSMSVCAAKT